jgi:peptidoglycan/LPS O-acetylase OafA/YrhL
MIDKVDALSAYPAGELPAENRNEPTVVVANKKTFLVGLDSLRAIAALSVCFFHYTNGMLPKLVVPQVKAMFSEGALGVDIFFVISGFIIPYSLVGKGYEASNILPYLKKRIMRINPPAYASLVLVLAQWFLIDLVINKNNNYTGELSVGQLIHNLLFTVPFTHYTWINNIFWTLAIEFQFYIFIGLLFNYLFSRNVIWFAGIYLLMVLVGSFSFFLPAEFFHYSAVFALGGVALLWHQRRIAVEVYLAGLLLFGGVAFWQLGAYVAFVGVATAVAINALRVSIPGLSFLGKISYSIYLMHGLLGTTAEFVLIKILPPTSDARKLLLTACCLLVAVLGAYAFYRLVEKPFMRLAAQNRK